MSYTKSVQELVTELRRGTYLPAQQSAADTILLQARMLDTLTLEIERLSSVEIERDRLRAEKVIAFGMRE